MSLSSESNTEKYLDLGHTEAENHAKAQQKLYEKYVAETSSVTRRIDEFVRTNIVGFGWHYLRSRLGRKHPYQYYPANDDTGVYPLQPALKKDNVTIALLSDWANDTKESDAVAHTVARYVPDYTLHLGDIYFVGTPKEVEENFTAPHASWYYGKSGSLTLSGNHEMYSNGNAFFNHLLPAMYAMDGQLKRTQQAGFFCLENEYWRIIGLDTGYTSVGRPLLEVLFPPDCHLRKEQVEWLEEQVRLGDPSDRRGIIFLSHHPVISGFRKGYPKPAEQIAEILNQPGRPVIWFWGHEHRLIGYKFQEAAKGLQVYGRCIGTGGMPVEMDLPPDPRDRDRIAFYDQRVRARAGRHDIGYNGFVMLTLKDDSLIASYRDLEDKPILEERWRVDINTGELSREPGEYAEGLSIYSQ